MPTLWRKACTIHISPRASLLLSKSHPYPEKRVLFWAQAIDTSSPAVMVPLHKHEQVTKRYQHMKKAREESLQKTEENDANPKKARVEIVRPDPNDCGCTGYSCT